MSDEYTPTTAQVRDGFAIDPIAEYHDPLTNHTEPGRRAFDRWLAEHDREVAAEALDDAADAYYNNVSGSKSRPWARMFLRERAAIIREGRDG